MKDLLSFIKKNPLFENLNTSNKKKYKDYSLKLLLKNILKIQSYTKKINSQKMFIW